MAWEIDPSHSQINFSVRHMMFAKVRGAFKAWTASVDLADDLPASTVKVSIDVASIDTAEPKRDGHLRSPDFFDAEKFPKIEYRSKRVEKGTGSKFRVIGDLTIRDVTKEVALDVEQTGRGKDPWGGERVAFSAHTKINRTDFGLKWNQVLEAGGVLVGEDIDIEIEVQAVKK